MEGSRVLVSVEIFETVLQENGIPRHNAREIIERSMLVMAEKSLESHKYMNILLVKAIEMGVKPSKNNTISEQEAVKLLGKSPAFFRAARFQKRLTPNCVISYNKYRYTFHDLAEYMAKVDSYKPL